MYHIDANNPPAESASAVFENASLPSAELITNGSLATNASPGSPEATPSRIQPSPDPSLCTHSFSKAEPLQQAEGGTVMIAAWSQYQTVNQMRASPYYFYINLPIVPHSTTAFTPSLGSTSVHRHSTAASEDFEQQLEHASTDQHLALHSVHPVPIRYLRRLTPKQLEFVHGYLTRKRFQPGSELSKRVRETMSNIGRIMHPGEE